jgi:RNA recognition motif-containing protein
MTLYVGNLPFSADQESIQDLFAAYGSVHSVKLMTDRETGRPRGFGFVEMEDEGARAAMSALNGNPFQGRALRVNEAEQRPPRAPRAPRSW